MRVGRAGIGVSCISATRFVSGSSHNGARTRRIDASPPFRYPVCERILTRWQITLRRQSSMQIRAEPTISGCQPRQRQELPQSYSSTQLTFQSVNNTCCQLRPRFLATQVFASHRDMCPMSVSNRFQPTPIMIPLPSMLLTIILNSDTRLWIRQIQKQLFAARLNTA